MLFKDVIGQDTIKQKLIEEIQKGRIAHAQLFAAHLDLVNCQWPWLMLVTSVALIAKKQIHVGHVHRV